MKGSIFAAAAAAIGGVSAASHHRHAHGELFKRGAEASVCVPGCTTIYTTIHGEPTLVPNPPSKPSTAASALPSAATSAPVAPKPTSTYKPPVDLPTPVPEICPTPGTYTIAPTTVTVTVPTTTCVYPVVTTVVPGTYTPAPAPTTSAVEAPKPTTEAPAPAPTTSAVEAPKPSSASSSAPKPSATAPSTGGNLGGSGDHWAMTYTPYAEDASGSCKSADQVDSDIASIAKAGFQVVRVYSTDCSTLENVGSACEKYGLKMIIGIFVKATCDPTSQEIKDQVDAITAWGKWSMVELVVVGNECIFQGRCSASSLKQLIVSTKATIKSAGYTGPFTTAETVGVWQQSDVVSEICDAVDVVGGQIHPYFNAETAASDAGTFVKGQLEILESSQICGSKAAINLECGWPSGGSCNGKACPGTAEQATAISSIRELIGGKTVFFSFKNDEWKEPGSCGCERTWGCGDLF
ncbi:hypothetical protein COL922a_002624 [Colletotrichum nupharicola]|nr:hypothetical protein COL922a_002624 [Colletotrichum nupharicola]